MNSFLNIHVRILANQAQRQLAMTSAAAGGLAGGFSRGAAGAGVFGSTINGMRLDRFGTQLQWVGRQLQYNFTIPIVAAGAAATMWALENEKAMTRVTKVYGDATHGAEQYKAEIDSLERSFAALSNRFGIHQADVIGIAADWAAAGASGLALAKSVELTLMAMTLGEIEAKKATEALIAIQAQYGQNTEELTRTLAVLNMVENQTGISLAGLIDGFSRAAGVARSAGVDVRHLAAMLAALVPATGSAAQAGNALKTIFSRLLSPTKESREVLGLMGIEIDNLAWKSGTAEDRLMTLANAFNGLSSSQKNVVSSVIASRWQINKFEVLMRELLNPMGYYQRALQATATDQQIFAQMTKELNAVLDSNPRRLQIIWTMLKNGAADIIQPMIPLILHVAEALKNLVQWFSNLDPALQKLILGGLLFIAIIGPLVRYIGSTITLIAELAIGFRLLFVPIIFVVNALRTLVTVNLLSWATSAAAGMMSLGHTMIAVALAINRGVIAAFIGLVPAIFLAMGRVTVAIRVFAVAIPVMFAEMYRAILVATRVFGAALQAAILAGATLAGIAWRGTMFLMMTLTTTGWYAIQRAFALALVAIQGMLIAFATFAGGVWRAMLAGIIALTVAFGATVRSLFTRLIPALRAASLAIMAAVSGPWGIAIAGVIAVLVLFWDQIVAIWNNVVNYLRENGARFAAAFKPITNVLVAARNMVQRAFNSLPEGIKNALMAVVRIVAAAVMKVYELLSYLNPFARHSPSLVENVTNGVAVIQDQYNSLGNIGGPFAQASSDLDSFGEAIQRLRRLAEAREFAELRKELIKIGFEALPEFDRLVKALQPLRRELAAIEAVMRRQQAVVDQWKTKLDAANIALDKQQAILDKLQEKADGLSEELQAAQAELDRFANAPIEGMRAMEDLIFANQMEQKALRLEMMRMEDAVGPLDQLQGRLDAINGQIELLSGEQANLRNAGAGGEILSFYDDQINLLEEQKEQIDAQIQPLEDMQQALQDLQREAEILDLEKALAFDPLTRQIEQMTNAMEELPFDEIVAGITESQAKVDELTTAYEAAQAAVEAQEAVVDQLKAARDALQLTYDTENAKLEVIKNQYQQVEEQIRDIEQALNDVGQAARSASAAMSGSGSGSGGGMSPGAENFLGAAGGNFPDPGGFDQIGREGGWEDQSKAIDDFTKEMAEQTKNMFGAFDFLEPVKKAWNSAMGWLRENIGPGLGEIGNLAGAAFENIPNPFGDTDFGSVKDTITDIFGTIEEWGKKIWDLFGGDLKDLFGETWGGIKEIFKQVQPELAKFKELIGPIGDLISQQWAVVKPVLGIVLGLIMLIIKAFTGAFIGAIKPVLTFIGDFIAAVIRTLRGLIEFVVGVLTLDWELAWNGIKDFFGGIWDAMYAILRGAIGLIVGVVKGLVEGIWEWCVWLWDILFGHSVIVDIYEGFMKYFNLIKSGVSAIWTAFMELLKAAWNNILLPLWNTIKATIDTLRGVFKAVVDFVKARWDDLVAKFNWAKGVVGTAVSNIKSVWNTLIDGFKAVVDKVKGWIDKFVSNLKDIKNRFSFGGIFDGLKSAFRSAVNWIIDKWNGLSFGVGPFSVDTPNMPKLAKGGLVANQAMAIVGEGRRGYPEYVIPTDPAYRKRALTLFSELGGSLGVKSALNDAVVLNALQSIGGRFKENQRVQFFASGGTFGGRVRRMGGTNAGMFLVSHTEKTEVHFHGDLSFPNVKNGDDAEEFLRNLEALVSEV